MEPEERSRALAALTMQDAVIPGAEVHAYRETPSRTLRIHVLPDRPSDRPSLTVLFHGGGWKYGSPLFVGPHAHALASLGLAVALPEYRVSHRDQTTIADAVDDAIAAVEWARENASDLGCDSGRVVLAGSSAGAHLALMVAAMKPDAASALILWNTPCDLADVAPGADLSADQRRQLSPITHVRDAASYPPMVLFHAVDDAVVPVSGTSGFAEAVNAAGGSARLITFEGGHGFERPEHDSGAAMRKCLDATRSLLAGADTSP